MADDVPFWLQPRKNPYIDPEVLGRLLCDVADVFDKHGMRYVLIYGTLLGAIRDKALIPWDDDVDLAVFNSARDIWWNKVVPDLIDIGCRVPPEGNPNEPISNSNPPWYDGLAFREGEKVECWFHDAVNDSYAYDPERCGPNYTFDAHFFDDLRTIEFLGREFNVPAKSEDFLYTVYGPNWQTPIRPDEPQPYTTKPSESSPRY